MAMKNVMVVMLALLMAACGSGSSDNAAKNPSQEKVKTPYTANEWRRDFLSSFRVLDEKPTNDDGIKEYRACFEPKEESCGKTLFGQYDGFNKFDRLDLPGNELREMASRYAVYKKPYELALLGRVVAPECSKAFVQINPKLYAKNWMFLEKISMMADGNVVFEKTVESNSIKRQTTEDGLLENWGFLLQSEDIGNLERFIKSDHKLIRVTGQKGFISVPKDDVDSFSRDLASLLTVTQQINSAVEKGGGPQCAK